MKWQSLQNSILTKRQNRVDKEELRKLQIESSLDQWRKENDAVQNQLDDKTDTLRNEFADVSFALTHDVGNMEKKFKSVPKVCCSLGV